MMPRQVGRLLGILAVVVAVVALASVFRPNPPRRLVVRAPEDMQPVTRPESGATAFIPMTLSQAERGGGTVSSPATPVNSPRIVTTSAEQLYRAAREAMIRGDQGAAITLFERVASHYPRTAYAAAALYYRAFLQYREYTLGKPTPLRAALATLHKLRRDYPKAPQQTDAMTLETRVCGELAKLGDSACRTQIVRAAQQLSGQITFVWSGTDVNLQWGGSKSVARAGTRGITVEMRTGDDSAAQRDPCTKEQGKQDEAIATLSSLWKVDSTRAVQMTGQILGDRGPCFTRLREQALILISQRPTPVMAMAPVVFDAARNDPSSQVRQLAKMWLLSQEWDEPSAKFLQANLGDTFKVKTKVGP